MNAHVKLFPKVFETLANCWIFFTSFRVNMQKCSRCSETLSMMSLATFILSFGIGLVLAQCDQIKKLTDMSNMSQKQYLTHSISSEWSALHDYFKTFVSSGLRKFNQQRQNRNFLWLSIIVIHVGFDSPELFGFLLCCGCGLVKVQNGSLIEAQN